MQEDSFELSLSENDGLTSISDNALLQNLEWDQDEILEQMFKDRIILSRFRDSLDGGGSDDGWWLLAVVGGQIDN